MKRFIFFLNQIINYLVGLIIVIFIVLVSPIKVIRLFPVPGNRLGHFTANIEIFLCEGKANINRIRKDDLVIFFYMPNHHGQKICNNQIDLMWQRVIKIKNEYPYYFSYKIIDYMKEYINFFKIFIAKPIGHCYDPLALIEKYPPFLKFTEEEKFRGKKELLALGIPEGSEFVCLICRDSSYLRTEMPALDWKYHDYRNVNIDQFREAALYLANKGIYVLRMGKHVDQRFNLNNKFIIDYANSKLRSDFMDVYLGANCKFCITTQTGFDGIPHIFRRPLATITMPVGDGRISYSKSLFITKHHFCKSSNKRLALEEIFERNLGFAQDTNDFNKKGVFLRDPSKNEIKMLVSDMLDLIDSPDQFNTKIDNNQLKFNKTVENYIQQFDRKRRYGEISRSRFSSYFINETYKLTK